MAIIEWKTLATFDILQPPGAPGRSSPVEVGSPWMVALEPLGDATYLKIDVDHSEWVAMPGLPPCGADGLPAVCFPSGELVTLDCAVGALVGRVGGSAATLKTAAAAEGRTADFPVGSICVVPLPDKAVGPLFLGFNLLHRPVRVTALKVTIFGAKPVF